MAAIRSYTTVEQSRKLAEILPLESADMYYFDDNGGEPNFKVCNGITYYYDSEDCLCCWSLAALLEQLKSEIILENKQILFLHINKYDDTDYEIRYTNSWTGEVFIAEADNLVDACVAMIESLHKLNLI